mgnify:CR=1 FL=1
MVVCKELRLVGGLDLLANVFLTAVRRISAIVSLPQHS